MVRMSGKMATPSRLWRGMVIAVMVIAWTYGAAAVPQAHADASGVGGTLNGHVVVLDSANDTNHHLYIGQTTVNADGINVNGPNASATYLDNKSTTNAPISVQASGITKANNGNVIVNGTVSTNQGVAGDPLASLAAPTVPSAQCPGTSCGPNISGSFGSTVNLNSAQTYSLKPGHYGPVNFNSTSTACLAPGVYYILIVRANLERVRRLVPTIADGL